MINVIIFCAVVASIHNEKDKTAPPGVIVKKLGKVSLAKDFFTIKIDVSEFKEFTNSLKEAKVALQAFLDKNEKSKVIKSETRDLLKSFSVLSVRNEKILKTSKSVSKKFFVTSFSYNKQLKTNRIK